MHDYSATVVALNNTVAALGIQEQTLRDDAAFISHMIHYFNERGDLVQPLDRETLFAVMDCAFVGLVYHRHMPYLDPEDNDVSYTPEPGSTDYTKTVTMLMKALSDSHVASPAEALRASIQGALVGRRLFSDEGQRNEEDADLMKDFMNLCGIGHMVHALLPSTNERPSL